MRKHFRTVALGVAVAVAVAGCGSAPSATGGSVDGIPDSPVVKRVKEAGVLKAGVALFLPFVGLDPATGEYFGTGVDLGKRMAEKLGVKLEIVPTDWDVMVASLQSSKIDVAIAGLFVTPERLEVVDMYPYSTMGTCWLALKTNDKVGTLADLNSPDVTMAQQEGGGTYQLSLARYPKAKQLTRLVGAGAEFANITEVKGGQADVAPFDSVWVPVLQADYPELKIIPEDCPKTTDFTAGISTAYPKGDAGMHQLVQVTVAVYRDEIEANLRKYSAVEYLRP